MTQPMTAERLAEIEAMAKDLGDHLMPLLERDGAITSPEEAASLSFTVAYAVVASREDVPDLCAEVRRLRKALDRIAVHIQAARLSGDPRALEDDVLAIALAAIGGDILGAKEALDGL